MPLKPIQRGVIASTPSKLLFLLVLFAVLFPLSTPNKISFPSIATEQFNTTAEDWSPLHERQDDAEVDYSKAIDGGRVLDCLMQNTKAAAEIIRPGEIETQFRSFDQMRQNWEYGVQVVTFGDEAEGITGGGISLAKSNWKGILHRWKGFLLLTKNGEIRRIKSTYENLINVREGAISALSNWSPAGTAKENNIAKETYEPLLPKPYAWSDVLFLQYQEMCTNRRVDVKLLEHVFRVSIVNEDTINIMEKALGEFRDAEDWEQRVTFKPTPPGSTEEDDDNRAFYALLKSPNVQGVAWMLIQHKDDNEFGLKYIESITIFGKDGIGSRNMYIHICPWRQELSSPAPAGARRRMESGTFLCP